MIRFTCCNPSCGKSIRTGDSAAGKKGRCPFCELVQLIPGDAPAQPEATSATTLKTHDPASVLSVASPPPAKKMYRQYPGADSGRARGVAIKMGGK
jgi:hypothetical protein